MPPEIKIEKLGLAHPHTTPHPQWELCKGLLLKKTAKVAIIWGEKRSFAAIFRW
jgi:hypothetical protein